MYFNVHSACGCAKMQSKLRMDLFAPTEHISELQIRFAKNTGFQVGNKFQNTSFIQFILWKMPYTVHRASAERALHVSIAFFVSNTPIHLLGRISNTTTIEYFRKYSGFCLFIYLFSPSQVGNGQKCVISHPFTRAFRQKPNKVPHTELTYPQNVCVCNK